MRTMNSKDLETQFDYEWVGEIETLTKGNASSYRQKIAVTDSKGQMSAYFITFTSNEEKVSQKAVELLINAAAERLLKLARHLLLGRERSPKALSLVGENYQRLDAKYYTLKGDPYNVDITQNFKHRLKHLETKGRIYSKHNMDTLLVKVHEQIAKVNRQLEIIHDILAGPVDAVDLPKGRIEITSELYETSAGAEGSSALRVLGEAHMNLKRQLSNFLLKNEITLQERTVLYRELNQRMHEMRSAIEQGGKIPLILLDESIEFYKNHLPPSCAKPFNEIFTSLKKENVLAPHLTNEIPSDKKPKASHEISAILKRNAIGVFRSFEKQLLRLPFPKRAKEVMPRIKGMLNELMGLVLRGEGLTLHQLDDLRELVSKNLRPEKEHLAKGLFERLIQAPAMKSVLQTGYAIIEPSEKNEEPAPFLPELKRARKLKLFKTNERFLDELIKALEEGLKENECLKRIDQKLQEYQKKDLMNLHKQLQEIHQKLPKSN